MWKLLPEPRVTPSVQASRSPPKTRYAALKLPKGALHLPVTVPLTSEAHTCPPSRGLCEGPPAGRASALRPDPGSPG